MIVDWLRDSFDGSTEPSGTVITARLVVAAFAGYAIALSERWSREPRGEREKSLTATLVLLTVIIAMVTMTIGDSVARAFGLVGALSIVRFRTVVDDTRDTVFVIFVTGVGMAIGAGFRFVPLIAIPVVGVTAYLLSLRSVSRSTDPVEFILTVRSTVGRPPEEVVAEPLERYVERRTLTAVSTARQGAAIESTYLVRLRDAGSAIALVTDLNAVDGVQSVEIKIAKKD